MPTGGPASYKRRCRPVRLAPRPVLPAQQVAGSSMSLLAALGTAFLGGLILNLMPCVFPVLSLKLIGLAQHRTHSGPMAAHGVAFAVGVVLSFVLLAALLIGLQQAGSALGWGFQLQTPWVVAALTVLFFAIGLNLLGVFEFTMGTGVANLRAADALAQQIRLARQLRYRRAGGHRRFAVHRAVHGRGTGLRDHTAGGDRAVGIRRAGCRYGRTLCAADIVPEPVGKAASARTVDGIVQAVHGVPDVCDLRLVAVGAGAASRRRRCRARARRFGGSGLHAVGARTIAARCARISLGCAWLAACWPR